MEQFSIAIELDRAAVEGHGVVVPLVRNDIAVICGGGKVLGGDAHSGVGVGLKEESRSVFSDSVSDGCQRTRTHPPIDGECFQPCGHGDSRSFHVGCTVGEGQSVATFGVANGERLGLYCTAAADVIGCGE